MKIRLAEYEIRIRLQAEEVKLLEHEILEFRHPVLKVSPKKGSSFSARIEDHTLMVTFSDDHYGMLKKGIHQIAIMGNEKVKVIIEEDWGSRIKE